MDTRRMLFIVLAIGLGLSAVFLMIVKAEPTQTISALNSLVNGNRFPVASGPGDQQAGVVAYDQSRDRFLVIYENAGGDQIAACVSSLGTIIESYIIGPGQNADVVYADDHDKYFIVFDHNNRIKGKTINGTCCPTCTSSIFTISNDRPGFEYGPAVAYNTHDSH